MEAERELSDAIARLERRCRLAFLAAAIGSAGGLFAFATVASGHAAAAPSPARSFGTVRVRELDVVDAKGVTRVRIGAPLPNAVIDGKQLTRGGAPSDTMSGILLFDADGVERSGYATTDRGYSNVMLTLDDKHRQHAMFIAEPTGATTLRLFNADTKDRVDVAIDGDGPSIAMIRRGKEVARLPAN